LLQALELQTLPPAQFAEGAKKVTIELSEQRLERTCAHAEHQRRAASMPRPKNFVSLLAPFFG